MSWPDVATIAITNALSQEHDGLLNIITWVIGRLGLVTLALVWVWVAGLRFLRRSGRPLWQALAWATGCCSCSSRSPPARGPRHRWAQLWPRLRHYD